MSSTNYGTSNIWNYSHYSFSNFFRPTLGTNSFVLGLNAPYGGSPNPPKQGDLMMVGASDTGGPERLDDWNHGAMWNPARKQGMSLCIGAARSGKGAGIIVPGLLNYAGNVVVNDPKGENFWVTGDRRRKAHSQVGLGHKTVLSDPFGEVNRAYGSSVGVIEKVTKYNPLGDLNPESLDFAEDVAAIGEAITLDVGGGGGGENANFFSGSGRDMIDGLIAATVTDAYPRKGTLRNVRQWLNIDNAGFATAVQDYCDRFPDSLGAGKLRQFSDMTDRTNIGVKSTAKQQTVFLDSEQLLRYMEPAEGEETFSFSELTTGKLDVYLVLPATHTVNYKRWLRMMVNQSMRAVLRNGVPDLDFPVTYFLDEAGTSLGHLEVIENAYGLTSGMGVLCWSFYQDISQMKRDYPQSWGTFIANSATIQLLRVGDLETAKYFSEHMGQMTQSTVTTADTQGSGAGGWSRGSSTNYGETGRAVLMPDELMRLSEREMIVMYAGEKPYRQFKVRYFSDARFNHLYRMDPKRQKQFPEEIAPPPHIAPGTQGWWIRVNADGTGNCTYTMPAAAAIVRKPFVFPKVPEWVGVELKTAPRLAVAVPVGAIWIWWSWVCLAHGRLSGIADAIYILIALGLCFGFKARSQRIAVLVLTVVWSFYTYSFGTY